MLPLASSFDDELSVSCLKGLSSLKCRHFFRIHCFCGKLPFLHLGNLCFLTFFLGTSMQCDKDNYQRNTLDTHVLLTLIYPLWCDCLKLCSTNFKGKDAGMLESLRSPFMLHDNSEKHHKIPSDTTNGQRLQRVFSVSNVQNHVLQYKISDQFFFTPDNFIQLLVCVHV